MRVKIHLLEKVYKLFARQDTFVREGDVDVDVDVRRRCKMTGLQSCRTNLEHSK